MLFEAIMKMENFRYDTNKIYSDQSSIDKCKKFAQDKLASVDLRSHHTNINRRNKDRAYENLFYGKLAEFISSDELKSSKLEANTSPSVEIFDINDDGGSDLIDQNRKNYDIKQTKACNSYYLLTYDYKIPPKMGNSSLYHQIGNSVPVPVVQRIASNIVKALNIVDERLL